MSRDILSDSFSRAERAFLSGQAPPVPVEFREATDTVFASKTQAYREVLVGCILTRLTDPTRNIRLPYLDLGSDAFSGRSLDERVVNPFLQERSIPCSRGPYLSVFRRQVGFDESTRARLRDRKGYDGFLGIIRQIEHCGERHVLLQLLDYLMHRFILLREEAQVELLQLDRMSLRQHAALIDGLLARSSGGVFPCLLVLSMVEVLAERFGLPWAIDSQGTNVADAASGAGGDITVCENGKPLLTIEVTERSVDAPRVQATFRAKIATAGLSDYVFAVHLARVEEEALGQAEKYFSQGHEVVFADIRDWLVNSLVTVGSVGRAMFHRKMREHLAAASTLTALRVAWNEEVERLTR